MSLKKQIRVALAESQPDVRQSLSDLMLSSAGLRLVGNAADAEEAVQLCQLVQPDVILIAEDIPARGGIEAARLILRRWPLIKVILLVDSEDDHLAKNALEAGVSGVVLKDIRLEQLQQVISAVCLTAREAPDVPDGQASQFRLPASPADLSRELADAARVQASFMPLSPPLISGWDISARLVPARETSGDFYDFIPLPNGNLGLVIADVTDKGMGAALFMAMSSTLIRTYASLYPTLPAFVMGVVNQRILEGSGGSMHVTAFYGVLEPDTGRLSYVNAGHNPPYLLTTRKGKPFDKLKATGTPLGVTENNYFQQKVIRLAREDTLLLYTDGIVEARSPLGGYFGEQRLLASARSVPPGAARDVQEAVFAAVYQFLAGASVEDDMALMVVARQP